jgi:anti-anti-sigma factor
MRFVLTCKKKDSHLVFYLSGDLTYEGSCTLKEAFGEAIGRGEKRLVLNLEGLKIIASYSLSTILKLSYLAKKNHATLAIVCPEGNVWDVFYVLEIGKVIPLFSSEEELWKWAKPDAGAAAV